MIELHSKMTVEKLKKEMDSYSTSPFEVDPAIRNLRLTEENHFVNKAKSVSNKLKLIESARYYYVVELEYKDIDNTICHVRLILPNDATVYKPDEQKNDEDLLN